MATEENTPQKKATAKKKVSAAAPRKKATVTKAPVAKKTAVRKVVKKAAASKKTSARAATGSQRKPAAAAVPEAMTPEQRAEMISTMAYYRAQARGFEGGSELEDWLESEQAVDRLLKGS